MKLREQTIIGIILAAVVARLMMAGIPNVSPIAALALFSGAYLADRKLALIIPLVAMLIGDMVLGFHNTMIFVYGAFALIAGIGIWMSRYLCGHIIISASLISSVLFFLVTNFGIWLVGGYYPLTIDGLLTCYIAAIPFFQMTLMGDLFFVGLMFGGFMALEHWLPGLRKSSEGAAA